MSSERLWQVGVNVATCFLFTLWLLWCGWTHEEIQRLGYAAGTFALAVLCFLGGVVMFVTLFDKEKK